MIVDEKHKVIYLHNPKCGGTFLRDIYIEKYGETDATRWWVRFTIKYGTDLAHITYDDLHRFIPEYEDYRIVVMIRNPYNRFYSAAKETHNQYKLYRCSRFIYCPRYVWHGEYREWSWLKKRFDFFRRIYPGVYSSLSFIHDSEEFCKYIFSLKNSKQDFFIRNKRIPWLNPQSYFWGDRVKILKYESESDWYELLEMFGLSEYQQRLSIARDYDIPDKIRKMIEKLYPEDRMLFRMY